MSRYKSLMYKLLILAVVVFATFLILKGDKGNEKLTEPKIINKTSQKKFNLNKYSINNAGSLWVVVNKQRVLKPLKYQPVNLRTPNIPLRLPQENPEMLIESNAAMALENMNKNAELSGVKIVMVSGFRSYDLQAIVYESNVSKQGKEKSDQESARPGFSEHQTGLALDLNSENEECLLKTCFAQTETGKWLAENSYKYGFILRYNDGQEKITGYVFEPWHFRYVGVELAALVQKENKPLETIFNLPPAPSY